MGLRLYKTYLLRSLQLYTMEQEKQMNITQHNSTVYMLKNENVELHQKVIQLNGHIIQLETAFEQKKLKLEQEYKEQLQLDRVSNFLNISPPLSLWEPSCKY